MAQFLGEYECNLDSKGRVMLPAGLRKQFSPEANGRFVVNRGFEQCLALYPYDEWEKISAEVNKLNLYVKKNRDFARYFFRGATELNVDGAGRLNLPQSLLEYAGVQKTAILFAFNNRVEIWDKKRYDSQLMDEPENFAQLAEEVMGGHTGGGPGDQSHNPEQKP